MAARIVTHTFQPRARLLLLLGDQLIRDAGLAVFELVKNAYDADARRCSVTMHDITDARSARVVVEDDGVGMDLRTITDVWLEPGTDHRIREKANGRRSRRFHRLPLGEKGVGRFAVHKLGRKIALVSRMEDSDEVVVELDWADFEKNRYLSDVPVKIVSREPMVFLKKRTGTRIEVTHLSESWTRGKVRDLHRAMTSICSPFDEPAEFETTLTLQPESDWLEGLVNVSDAVGQALFKASGTISGKALKYDYEFTPLPAMQSHIGGRKRQAVSVPLMSVDPKGQSLDLGTYDIGTIDFTFYIFDRDPRVLDLATSDKAGLKRFLDQNGGLRIYRDGIRVFDFGEPGNDWLELGGRRVNIPTVRVSNNQLIGAVALRGLESAGLTEKTNREGFIENDAYEAFRQAVLFALTQVEAERSGDKERLRKIYSSQKSQRPVLDEIAELREALQKRNLIVDLGRHLDRIETQFEQASTVLLTAAGSGLTLTTVVHEVEKIIRALRLAVKANAPRSQIKEMVDHLSQMVDGLTFLMRKSGTSTENASALIEQAIFNTEYRLRAHHIAVVRGFDLNAADFSVRCTRRLVIATLMNLIDNSIYWLENKGAKDKRIYLGATTAIDGGPALVVADNGPGFMDSPDQLTQPFFTRKPDGMGLGLYIADEVARLHKGRLLFPDGADAGVPKQFTGAIVALQFPERA